MRGAMVPLTPAELLAKVDHLDRLINLVESEVEERLLPFPELQKLAEKLQEVHMYAFAQVRAVYA